MPKLLAYADTISAPQLTTISFFVNHDGGGQVSAIIERYNPTTGAYYEYDSMPTQVPNFLLTPWDWAERGCGWGGTANTYSKHLGGFYAPGIYRAKFANTFGNVEYAYFVVTTPIASGAGNDFLYIWPTATWAAYNFDQRAGAPSSYGPQWQPGLYEHPNSWSGRRRRVSTSKPGMAPLLGSEWSWAFLEQNGFHCDAWTSYELGQAVPSSSYKCIVLNGHDEYWSKPMRDNLEAFLVAGGNVLCLSGNTMWWQIRHSDGGRTIECYKSALEDPNTSNPTTKFCDGTLDRPENTVTGLSSRAGAQADSNDNPSDPEYPTNQLSVIVDPSDPNYSWVFAGASLSTGSPFGGVSYETDARDTDGRGGTPLNWNELASASLSSWHKTPGRVSFGYYRRNGVFFHVGSWGFAKRVGPLVADAVSRRVVKNVATTLRTRSPSVFGSAYSLRSIPATPSVWQQVPTTTSVVVDGLAAHVGGQLFAATPTQLLQRPLDGDSAPWTTLESFSGNAAGIGARPLDPIAPVATACPLMRPAGTNVEVRSPLAPGWSASSYTAPEALHAVGGDWTNDWGIGVAGSLLYNVRHTSWTRLGDAPTGLEQLGFSDEWLIGRTATRVIARDVVAVDATWYDLGALPANTRAFTASNGRLWAADNAGALWWRKIAPAGPVQPGNLIFYKQSTGLGATALFAASGEVVAQQIIPGFSTDWTHCVPAAGVAVFYSPSGRIGVAQIDRATGSLTTLYSKTVLAGASIVCAISDRHVLIYKTTATTAQVEIYRISTAGATLVESGGSYGPGWTHLAKTSGNRLFWYNSSNGNGWQGSYDSTTESWPPGAPLNGYALGWTHIVPAGNNLLFFFKNTGTGAAGLGRLTPTGAWTDLALPTSPLPPNSGVGPAWQNVVGGINGLVLFYQQANAAQAVIGFRAESVSPAHSSYWPLRQSQNSFSNDWTHIWAV